MKEAPKSTLTLVIAGVAGRMGREVARIAAGDHRVALVGGLEARNHELVGKTLRELGFSSDAPIAADLEEIAAARSTRDTARLADGAPVRPVLVEFCLGPGAIHHVARAAELGFAVVSGSTGLEASDEEAIRALGSRTPIVRSPNFSRGALAVIRYGARLAGHLGSDYDVEVVETHHRAKRDVPSGTAAALAEAVRRARNQAGSRIAVGRRAEEGARAPAEIGVHSVRAGTIPGEHRLVIAGEGESIELVHRVFTREAFARGALHAAWLAARLPPGFYDGRDLDRAPEGAGAQGGGS